MRARLVSMDASESHQLMSSAHASSSRTSSGSSSILSHWVSICARSCACAAAASTTEANAPTARSSCIHVGSILTTWQFVRSMWTTAPWS